MAIHRALAIDISYALGQLLSVALRYDHHTPPTTSKNGGNNSLNSQDPRHRNSFTPQDLAAATRQREPPRSPHRTPPTTAAIGGNNGNGGIDAAGDTNGTDGGQIIQHLNPPL